MRDLPRPPAAVGTFSIGPLGANYTAGPLPVTWPALMRLLEPGEPIAVDIETFGLGLDARRIKCVAFANRREAVVLDPRAPLQAAAIRRFMAIPSELVFHNSPFDVPNLAANGLITVPDVARVVDTLVFARLAWPDIMIKKSLEDLAFRLLGLTTEGTVKDAFRRLGLTIKEGFKRLDIDAPMYLMGVAVDAIVTARCLAPVMHAALATTTQDHPFSTFGVTGADADRLVIREQIVNRMLLRRSVRGLRVDLEYLDAYQRRTSADRSAAEAELGAHGIRPGNPGDLLKYLDGAGALPEDHPRTAKTGRPSTTAAHLERLDHPLAKLFVTAKRITKVQEDYLQKVVDLSGADERIHPVVNLLAATTGRMSMGEPPLQQFPEPARGIILADPGDTLTSIDWAQIEPVVAANIAGDLGVLSGYEDGTSDLYTELATLAGVKRKTAKVILLAQMYGEGLGKLSADLGIERETAAGLRDAIFTAMPRVGRLLWKLRDIGEQYRKVFTLSGRILTVPMGRGFDGGPPTVATHKAVNYFVQGSAYDLLADALVRIEHAGLGDAVYLAMHDELVVSTPAAREVEQIMRTPPERLVSLAKRVPVLRTDRADLGERWNVA